MDSLTTTVTRRALFGFIAVVALFPKGALHAATALPEMKVTHSTGCGCCLKWMESMRRAGFTLSESPFSGMSQIKSKYGITREISSCHTAEVGGYAIEGHVPAAAILRLLAEKPKAAGLAVPGMPIGSPGMEGASPVDYDVILFGPNKRTVFARYNGENLLKSVQPEHAPKQGGKH